MSSYSDDLTFDDIGQLLMREMRRRLGNSEKAADLPGTLLMRLVEQYIKAVERRNEIEEAKLEHESVPPLQMIDQEGMPLDHRLQILWEYLDEVETEWRAASLRYVELKKEWDDAHPEEMQEGELA